MKYELKNVTSEMEKILLTFLILHIWSMKLNSLKWREKWRIGWSETFVQKIKK